jgi:hypothetical protein
MNDTSKPERIETVPVPSQYFSAPNFQHEITLVDAWIQVVRYKNAFIIAFCILFLVGLSSVLFLFKEKYTLTSALQIGSFSQNNQVAQLESNESLKSKLDNIFIPNITANWLEKKPETEKFSTTVTITESSDVVLIQHKVKESEVEQFIQVQSLINSAVIQNHDKKIKLYQADLRAQLQLENIKLDELKDNLTLKLLLDKEKLIIQKEQSKLDNIKKNLKIIEQGGPDNFLKSLNINEREGVVSNEGIVIDELLKLRFNHFLLENKIRQDEASHIINTSQIKLVELQKEHEEKVLRQELAINRIQGKLDDFDRTQVVTLPVLSLEPVGMTRSMLIVVLFFMSVIAGFAFMLMALFRDKVNQRLRDMNAVNQ